MTSLVDDLLMAATDCEGNRYGDLFTAAATTVEELEGVKAELLEALEGLAERYVEIVLNDTIGRSADDDAVAIARAAIAKAKGETT